MQTKGWILLTCFLNKFGHRLNSEEFKTTFLQDIAEEEAQSILNLPAESNQPELVLEQPERILQSIHYSWLTTVVKAIPEFIQPLALGLLPEKTKNRLSEKLSIIPKEGSFLRPIRMKILSYIYNELDAKEVMPKEFLPNSPLKPLLDVEKEELVMLIDLLGIHDLAEEMRSIVDRKLIKAVYCCLKPHQLRHLYICLHQQEKVVAAPLDLTGWTGNCTTLQKRLHVRGITRLAKALSGQHHDFIWYIKHALDVGRAGVLMQHLAEETIPRVTPALQQQVLQNLKYITSESKK